MLGCTYCVVAHTAAASRIYSIQLQRVFSIPLAVLGCTYYVVAAWIWALIWHMGLDPLKVRCGVDSGLICVLAKDVSPPACQLVGSIFTCCTPDVIEWPSMAEVQHRFTFQTCKLTPRSGSWCTRWTTSASIAFDLRFPP